MSTRPTRYILAERQQAWDAEMDANFAMLTREPLPVAEYSTVGDLPPASSFEQCIAIAGGKMYISNGSEWIPYKEATNIPDSTATDVEQMATDFNSLLAALRAAGIIQI
jgi:hypothetical protein